MANDICLDCVKIIKITDEEGIRNGLEFIVSSHDARINDQWRRGESQTRHFHVISLQNGFRFPLPRFVLELLHDYGLAPSQNGRL